MYALQYNAWPRVGLDAFFPGEKEREGRGIAQDSPFLPLQTVLSRFFSQDLGEIESPTDRYKSADPKITRDLPLKTNILIKHTYFPTKFSNTEDFPADWPPTTAICGRSMTMVTPSEVKASCMRLMMGMRDSIPWLPGFPAMVGSLGGCRRPLILGSRSRSLD